MTVSPVARQALDEVLEPVKRLRNALDREIEQLQTELSAKLDERKTLDRVLRAADPERQPKLGRSKSNGKASHFVSEAKMDEIRRWLQANADSYPDGFTATEVHRDADGAFKAASATVLSAMHHLHEAGELRLLRRGTGGGYVWQLVK